VNAESGVATCDDEGCGTFLRASKYPFDNAIQDKTRRLVVREREFAVLDVRLGHRHRPRSRRDKVEKLETGFWSISGARSAPDGALYFVDRASSGSTAGPRRRGWRSCATMRSIR
jgi:hypothetical protein